MSPDETEMALIQSEKSPCPLYYVELLQLKRSSIRVAENLTELPPREGFEGRLREALRAAQEGLKPALGANRELN